MNRIEEDIRSGEFARVYLLYGEEDYLRGYYTDRLRRAVCPEDNSMNLNTYEGKDVDVEALIEQARTMPFFAEHRMIIVKESGLFHKSEPRLAEFLEQVPEETVILFTESQTDGKVKTFKTVKAMGTAVECRRLDEAALTRWVLRRLQKEGMQIRRSAMELFLLWSGDDMYRVSGELEKLICYMQGRMAIEVEDVRAICTQMTENRIFAMIDLLGKHRRREALELYHDLLSLRESPIRILVLLGKQFERMAGADELQRQGLGRHAIAERMGVKDFQVRIALEQARQFTPDRLREILTLCVEADESIKTGRMPESLAVETVICSV